VLGIGYLRRKHFKCVAELFDCSLQACVSTNYNVKCNIKALNPGAHACAWPFLLGSAQLISDLGPARTSAACWRLRLPSTYRAGCPHSPAGPVRARICADRSAAMHSTHRAAYASTAKEERVLICDALAPTQLRHAHRMHLPAHAWARQWYRKGARAARTRSAAPSSSRALQQIVLMAKETLLTMQTW